MRDALREIYALITYRRGGGTYGYLGELLSDAVYVTVAPSTVFITPPDPKPIVIPTGSTKFNLGNLNRDHSETCR